MRRTRPLAANTLPHAASRRPWSVEELQLAQFDPDQTTRLCDAVSSARLAIGHMAGLVSVGGEP